MRRQLPLLVLGLALAGPPAPALAAASRQATARLVACHPALRPTARSLTVEGAMRIGTGGERMQMRFDLYRRPAPGLPAVRVPGPGLGVYNRAEPGIANYRFRKTIRNLPAPADYRVLVTFRWLSPSGALIARLVRWTPVCHQSELRPDLRVERVEISSADDPAEAVYTVSIRNSGVAGAFGFRVGLSLAGQPQPPVEFARLGAGETRSVRFTGLRCPAGEAAVATADPDRRVAEASEANNVRGVPCAAAARAAP